MMFPKVGSMMILCEVMVSLRMVVHRMLLMELRGRAVKVQYRNDL